MKVRNQEFIKQQIHQLITNPSFIKDIDNFRKKWKIPANGLKSDQETKQWDEDFETGDYEKMKGFAKDLSLLAQKYKKYQLGHFLITFLDFYVKFNKTTLIPLYNATIRFEPNPVTEEKELFIQIWPNTRKRDLINLWPQIKHWQKKLKQFSGASRKSNPTIIERDNYIFQLYQEGKPIKKIADSVYIKFADNEQLDEDQKLLYETAIYKIIERRKKN